MSTSTARKPRILFLTQIYDPEPAYKGQRFAEALVGLGYEVEVVTGFPNYPGGKVYDGYRIRPIERSEKNGVTITRVALYPSHDRSRVGRVLNYVSFFLSASAYATFGARSADLIHCYHPPLTVGLAGTVAGWLRRTPVVLDIHDLWPDTLPATGMISNPKALRVIDLACRVAYRSATHIVLHSHGFRTTLAERGVPADKMTTIIGWTQEHGEPPRGDEAPPEALAAMPGLKVLYAGNIGPAQALDTVLEAAARLQASGHGERVSFCFLGSGLSLDGLKEQAATLGLRNVAFLPRVTPAEVSGYYAAADCLLMHLRDDPLFAITMPSKMQSYLLAGKPILAGIRGEAAELITRAKAGVTSIPQDAESLAEAALRLADLSPEERQAMGEAGQAFYWEELSMEKGMQRLGEVLSRCLR